MALDPAGLRSPPAPARRDLVEALQACLAQGRAAGPRPGGGAGDAARSLDGRCWSQVVNAYAWIARGEGRLISLARGGHGSLGAPALFGLVHPGGSCEPQAQYSGHGAQQEPDQGRWREQARAQRHHQHDAYGAEPDGQAGRAVALPAWTATQPARSGQQTSSDDLIVTQNDSGGHEHKTPGGWVHSGKRSVWERPLLPLRRGCRYPRTPPCKSRRCSRRCACWGRPTAGRSTCGWTPPRSRLERCQVVVIHRLTACGVPDAEPLAQGGDGTRLTSTWRLAWSPATGALLGPAGLAGVTLEQAADGAARSSGQCACGWSRESL
jgi:hypothetical protein